MASSRIFRAAHIFALIQVGTSDESQNLRGSRQLDTQVNISSVQTCIDTPAWTNRWSDCWYKQGKRDWQGCTTSGWTCSGYQKQGWCRNGQQTTESWAFGSGLNNPERNCCACGGGSQPAEPVVGYNAKEANCYDGHGATDIDVYPQFRPSASSCAQRCNDDINCNCFVYGASTYACFKRSNCNTNQCADSENKYTTYTADCVLPQSHCGQDGQPTSKCCDDAVCRTLLGSTKMTCVKTQPVWTPSPTPWQPVWTPFPTPFPAPHERVFRAQLRSSANPAMCIDVAYGSTNNGATVQMYECSQTSENQYFLIPESGSGKIQWSAHPSKCLDVNNQWDNNGNAVQLWDCDAANTYHTFHTPRSDGYPQPIRWEHVASKCVVVDGNNFANGEKMQIWDCDDYSQAQNYFYVST